MPDDEGQPNDGPATADDAPSSSAPNPPSSSTAARSDPRGSSTATHAPSSSAPNPPSTRSPGDPRGSAGAAWQRFAPLATAAAIAAMVACAFAQRWHLLTASPYPVGIDGYFYPLQVRHLLEHGTLQYPSSPLTFYFMAPFALATDPITGAKLGAALGGALIAIPAYSVGARLGGGRGPGLLAAALASASAGGTYLSLEFVKQGFGLAVALAGLWLVMRALDEPTRRRVVLAALAALATFATHKLAGVTLVVVTVPAIGYEVRHRLRGRRLIYATLAAAAAGLGAIVLGLIAPQRFPSLADVALIGDAFDRTARWDAPALVTEHLTLAFDHEARTAGILALVAIALAVIGGAWPRRLPTAVLRDRRAMRDMIVGAMIVAIALVIAQPWLAVSDPQGIGFRLRIAAFVPLALCAALVVRGAAREPKAASTIRIVAGFVAAIVFARGMVVDRSEGRVLTHPALAAAVMAADGRVPTGATLIVPERHILFMAAWYTRAPVSLRPEPIPYPQRARLLNLVFTGGAGSPLDRAIDRAREEPTLVPPIGLHPNYRNGLVLVTEPTWDWLLAQLPPRDREYFAAWPTI